MVSHILRDRFPDKAYVIIYTMISVIKDKNGD
jgi:hypothetical protein